MIPTLVREPFHRPGWIYEEKVDGWRMLAYRDGKKVRLVSRTGVDHTKRFRTWPPLSPISSPPSARRQIWLSLLWTSMPT